MDDSVSSALFQTLSAGFLSEQGRQGRGGNCGVLGEIPLCCNEVRKKERRYSWEWNKSTGSRRATPQSSEGNFH